MMLEIGKKYQYDHVIKICLYITIESSFMSYKFHVTLL